MHPGAWRWPRLGALGKEGRLAKCAMGLGGGLSVCTVAMGLESGMGWDLGGHSCNGGQLGTFQGSSSLALSPSSPWQPQLRVPWLMGLDHLGARGQVPPSDEVAGAQFRLSRRCLFCRAAPSLSR